MSSIYYLLLYILKSTLKAVPIQTDKFVALSADEWQILYKISAKQGVLAIVYDVISQLPANCQPPRNIKLKWALGAEAIENRYKIQFLGASRLSELWSNEGIKTVVIKGFSLSKYYPVPNHRECGDFDCYLLGGKYEEGNVIAERNGAKVNREWYKHSQIFYRGMMAENHNYLVTTRKGRYAKVLNDVLIDRIGELIPLDDTNILLPSADFTALFVTYHSFAHFISEGITLRHLCDWACFLKAEQHNFNWDEFYELCKRFKFDRFVDLSNEIVTKYFEVELDDKSIICESPYTNRVLNNILYEDSKVFSSGKGRWHNRLKLIKNMFSYRWKHRDIAQSSSVRYFWNVVSGYLLKKEKH